MEDFKIIIVKEKIENLCELVGFLKMYKYILRYNSIKFLVKSLKKDCYARM